PFGLGGSVSAGRTGSPREALRDASPSRNSGASNGSSRGGGLHQLVQIAGSDQRARPAQDGDAGSRIDPPARGGRVTRPWRYRPGRGSSRIRPAYDGGDRLASTDPRR